MIEDIATKIVKAQVKSPYLFLLAFGLVAVLMFPGLFKLVENVEPSLEKVLPQDVNEVKVMNDMRSQFGADMMYLIVYAENPISDVRNPEFLNYVNVLSEKIRTREYVEDVNNVVDLIAQDGKIPVSIYEVKESMKNNPFVHQYQNSDFSFSVIRIRSDTGASASVIKKLVNEIKEDIESLESLNPGARTTITGFNAIDKATFEVIMSDFAVITLVSMILVGIVVFVTFKSFWRGMLPMVVVMNALLWTMAIAGYLGLTITVVSMVASAMIMGLGIDFGIHVVHSYFEQRKTKSSKKALRDVMQELLRAMIGASFTTIAGFLALLFGVLPAMKTLGIILAMGIFNTLIGAIFLLPVVVYLYDLKIFSKKGQGKNLNVVSKGRSNSKNKIRSIKQTI